MTIITDVPRQNPQFGLGVIGMLASLFAAIAFGAWWIMNGARPNVLTIGMALALASLFVAHLLMMIKRKGSPPRDRAGVVLSAVGLWVFVAVSVGGLTAAAAATQDESLAATAINVRMMLTGGVVALYAVVILGVRYGWIIRPMAQLAGGASVFPSIPTPANYPLASPLSDGYFLHERQVAQTRWIDSILKTSESRTEADWTIARAHDAAAGIGSLTSSEEALVALLAGTAAPDPRLVRRHALAVALTAPDAAASKTIYLTKVQNQLCVFTFVLLGAVAAFSILGWAAPMGVAAAAAIVFRIRELTPLGKPGSYDGGARWMALLMTPLTGAVSAVLGLTVVSALARVDIFSEKLAVQLLAIPGIGLDADVPSYGPLVLGLAVAFGWSARLLDDMLKSLTSSVETNNGGSDGGAASTAPAPASAPKDPALAAAAAAYQAAASAKAAAEAADEAKRTAAAKAAAFKEASAKAESAAATAAQAAGAAKSAAAVVAGLADDVAPEERSAAEAAAEDAAATAAQADAAAKAASDAKEAAEAESMAAARAEVTAAAEDEAAREAAAEAAREYDRVRDPEA